MLVLGSSTARLMDGSPSGMARRHLSRCRDPELRAQLTPDYTSAASASCSPTTTIRRSPSRTSSWSPTGSARCARTGSSTADGTDARSTRSSSAPASRHGHAVAEPRPRADGRRSPRSGRAARGATAARPSRASRTSSCRRPEHRPRPQLDGLHDRGPDRVRAEALRAHGARGAAAFESAPEAQDAYNAAPAAAARDGVDDGGCASWYLDAHGRNRTLWPGISWTFRRATRAFDPAEYELLAPRPAALPALAGVC